MMLQRQISFKIKKLFIYGDHVDTDRIIAGKYTKTLDRKLLAQHVLEDLDPFFAQTVQNGDAIIAGKNFGCGSSREQAPLALKSSGIGLIIARSFARIFFRNAINVGLPVMELPEHTMTQDSILSVDMARGEVIDHSQDRIYWAEPLPSFVQEIMAAGGLVEFLRDENNISRLSGLNYEVDHGWR
jgi:3-isopropylmalate dehydratase small subunit